jgi:type IV secretory pathway VirB10-like protein
VGDETSVPDDLEEQRHEELTPDAYGSTVPSRLTGFSGLNNSTLIAVMTLAVVVVVVVVVTILGRFHPGSNPSSTSLASRQTAAPAAGGLNNPDPNASPFVPEPQAFPTEMETTAPFVFGTPKPQRTPYVANGAASGPAYHPMGPYAGGQRPSSSSVAQTQAAGGGRMSLEGPNTSGASNTFGSQDQEAESDLDDPYQRVVYRPVFDRSGQLVMVVPVPIVSAARASRASIGYQSTQPRQSRRQAMSQQIAADYPSDNQNSPASYPGSPQYPLSATTAPPSSEFVSPDANGGGQDPAVMSSQNQQRFVKAQEGSGDVGYTEPVSNNQIDPTTVIAARLLSKIVSTLPGPVSAQVIAPVYDSATHSTIVIPAGTRLFGTYDNAVIENQNRLLMAWQRLVFPDGHEFVIAGQPGVDAQGAAGFTGDIDFHRGSLYTTAILLTVLAGAEAAVGGGSQQTCSTGGLITTGQTPAQAVQCSTGTQIASVANKILDKNLSRQPTIIIRPPYEFRVIVTRDLPLDKYLVR